MLAPTSPSRRDAFAPGDLCVLIDRRDRRYVLTLVPGEKFHGTYGWIDCDALIGAPPGLRARTSKGDTMAAYRPTLEEYVLLMPRAAQIVTPKDLAFIPYWADVFPGATVVEAGAGSGALTLALLRAVGAHGRVIAFELREEFANRARKNIEGWSDGLASRVDLRVGDVNGELAALTQVDRVVLDLPEPWQTVPAAAQALVPGGIMLAYLPNTRQVDRLAIAFLDHPSFAPPEVCEALVRPWVADRERLRPSLRMVSHSGFLVRARRRPAREPVREDP
ncbi:MAG: tRNA (adenine-N1)-methyltransferase [Deltaproteobacteria bacterium]|nr:tRNA (adenine-N1)-methyltransferase [Deltaproteobacteria bacterium]